MKNSPAYFRWLIPFFLTSALVVAEGFLPVWLALGTHTTERWLKSISDSIQFFGGFLTVLGFLVGIVSIVRYPEIRNIVETKEQSAEKRKEFFAMPLLIAVAYVGEIGFNSFQLGLLKAGTIILTAGVPLFIFFAIILVCGLIAELGYRLGIYGVDGL